MSTGLFVAEVLRYFIGFFMLAAGAGKLREFAQFCANLVASFGMPERAARLLAPAVVAAEFGAAALILGGAANTGMVAALAMLAAFTAVVSYKFFTESVVKCSCFGEAARSVSGFDLLRNLLAIAAAIAYLAIAGASPMPIPVALLAAGLATLLLVAAIDFHDIASLLVQRR